MTHIVIESQRGHSLYRIILTKANTRVVSNMSAEVTGALVDSTQNIEIWIFTELREQSTVQIFCCQAFKGSQHQSS